MQENTNTMLRNSTLKNKNDGEKDSFADFFAKNAVIGMPKVGDLIEGEVIAQQGPALFINLEPFGTGIIYGREFYNAKDIIKGLKPGDKITTKILELENEDGYIELSLQDAGKEIVWRELEQLQKDHAVMELPVLDANKGGLILDWKGLQGFLPTSQLKTAHYPRVENGDKDLILEELKKLIGKKIAVTILSVDPKEEKLIFSEKGTETEELREVVAKYKVGDVIEGEITGIVDFGVFVKIEEGLEGLVHISELDWSLVEDPGKLFKVGEKVQAKIIEIEDSKISLSIKALKPDPWDDVKDKYSKGDIVEGVVLRFNKYGALISIQEGVCGLVHISEFGSADKMKEKLEIGKTYPFQITLFEPKEHRLTLSYLDTTAS